jgi:hypothetical protein
MSVYPGRPEAQVHRGDRLVVVNCFLRLRSTSGKLTDLMHTLAHCPEARAVSIHGRRRRCSLCGLSHLARGVQPGLFALSVKKFR